MTVLDLIPDGWQDLLKVFLCLLFMVALIVLMYRSSHMTPASIREALDKLPLGICFSDPDGRIILCNDKMRQLSFELIGEYAQTIVEWQTMLQMANNQVASDQIKEGQITNQMFQDHCITLSNGQIFHFHFSNLTVRGEEGWLQLTAQDVTELQKINEQLQLENKKLEETNYKLKKMYDCIEETIREKESLEMKAYIHDTMGRSLLTIQDIMNSDENTEKKLAVLQEAVSVLSSNRVSSFSSIYEVCQIVADIGVKVTIQGNIPEDNTVERLIAAAIRECATNCLRHAHGDAVDVNVDVSDTICTVTITNNGEKPKEKIVEGSGLSNLRLSVEKAKGSMKLFDEPIFVLMLTIPLNGTG